MNRVLINIKDNEKVDMILSLLKELPFVEIESSQEIIRKRKRKRESISAFSDIFGIWENRDITLSYIRKKAWDRS
jgi:hypothetical protein